MFNSKRFRNYKKHCQPDKILSFELAVKALNTTYEHPDEHPKEFAVLNWVVSFN